jgi:hypothetical protein
MHEEKFNAFPDEMSNPLFSLKDTHVALIQKGRSETITARIHV